MNIAKITKSKAPGDFRASVGCASPPTPLLLVSGMLTLLWETSFHPPCTVLVGLSVKVCSSSLAEGWPCDLKSANHTFSPVNLLLESMVSPGEGGPLVMTAQSKSNSGPCTF